MELSKTKFNIYKSLSTSKMRKKLGLFTVEGEKSVADTISDFDADCVIAVSEEFSRINHLYGTICPVYSVTSEQMDKLSNLSTPSSIMAIYKMPERVDDNLIAHNNGLYVVLDGIQDPGNLGTIIRTCHWFGIKQIYASKDTVDIYNPKTVQSTMGSISKVNIYYCDLKDLISKNPDMPVYGLLLEGRDIFKEELEARGFIVMGNEGKGISDDIRKMITSPLTIPPTSSEHGESLNVAVATAITVALFRR